MLRRPEKTLGHRRRYLPRHVQLSRGRVHALHERLCGTRRKGGFADLRRRRVNTLGADGRDWRRLQLH